MGGWQRGITHCKRGHAFTETNTYRRPGGNRECRTCISERKRAAYRAKLREQYGPKVKVRSKPCRVY